MLRILVLFTALSFSLSCYSQKVNYDKKSNKVTVEGQKGFKLERAGCGLGMPDCHFDIYDESDKKVIRINYRDFKSKSEVSQSNPDGIVRYYEFIFLTTKKKCELKYKGLGQKAMAKLLVSNGLMVNGAFDPKAADEFVLVHGTPFQKQSDPRNQQ